MLSIGPLRILFSLCILTVPCLAGVIATQDLTIIPGMCVDLGHSTVAPAGFVANPVMCPVQPQNLAQFSVAQVVISYSGIRYFAVGSSSGTTEALAIIDTSDMVQRSERSSGGIAPEPASWSTVATGVALMLCGRAAGLIRKHG